jgi:parvulin-like peptidyl-prolyl isomerase
MLFILWLKVWYRTLGQVIYPEKLEPIIGGLRRYLKCQVESTKACYFEKEVNIMNKNNLITQIRRPFGVICITVFFAFLAFGCTTKKDGGEAVSKEAGEKSAVVAKIGSSSINATDFKSYLSQRSPSFRRQFSEESIKNRLDERIIEEVLYKEALRLKLDQDPKVQNNFRTILNQKLIREQVIQNVGNRKIEEKELRDYYNQHSYEYNRPEQVNLADIFIAVPPNASVKEKADLKKKAEIVLSEALKTKGNRPGFIRLSGKYSDTHRNYAKGNTGFFDKEGNPVGINKKLAEAAFRLENNGSISEHLIETPDGYHVIMRTGKRYATHRPFDRVRNQLRQRIRREEIQKKRQDYVEELKKNTPIQIDETVVAKIVTEMQNAQKQRPLPEKRFIPPERKHFHNELQGFKTS